MKNLILKNKLELNGYKNELDVFNNTVELVSR